jgi:hypothetical protein
VPEKLRNWKRRLLIKIELRKQWLFVERIKERP